MATNIDLFGNFIIPDIAESWQPTQRSPFDFVNSISSKKYIDDTEGYVPYIVNAAFSQRKDLVIYANEMNKYHQLGDREQYDFYFHGLPKKNMFAKWAKGTKHDDDTKAVAAYYETSLDVAKNYKRVLKPSQLSTITEWYKTREGGK